MFLYYSIYISITITKYRVRAALQKKVQKYFVRFENGHENHVHIQNTLGLHELFCALLH